MSVVVNIFLGTKGVSIRRRKTALLLESAAWSGKPTVDDAGRHVDLVGKRVAFELEQAWSEQALQGRVIPTIRDEVEESTLVQRRKSVP